MADTRPTTTDAWPRWINLVAGVWLFISAFVWPHTAAAQNNTWIVGVLIVLASLWAMFAPSVRFINTILAVYLFISTFGIFHQNPGTVWNNVIVSIIVFVLSLVPSETAYWTRGHRTPAHAA